jgi:hypothetical protein
MLCASAQQFVDWSAAYRLFDQERFNREALFKPARQTVLERLGQDEPLVAAMDDTLIRKRGRKVYGAAWKRDPLGPKFQNNFVWGQRFLQMSALLPDKAGTGQARGVPIDFIHAPSPVKPRKNASGQEWESYRQQKEASKISSVGAETLRALRSTLDGQASKNIICSIDGGFTNRTVLRDIPEKVTLVGRIRKDAKLFSIPPANSGRGRQRWYGEPLPTPEQIREDDSRPWETVEAFAAGRRHTFQVKRLLNVRWAASGNRTVQVLVLRPLAYRPRKGAKLLYRDPAYLICTDPDMAVERFLQAYLWRWEIELNFRDEKTLLGVGEAQVRKENSTQSVPAFIVAAYAFLLLAGTAGRKKEKMLPRPKWQQNTPTGRSTTQQMISLFRSHLWGQAINGNLKHFASAPTPHSNQVFLEKSLPYAVCYAAK